jgi:hypothetical protein
MRCLVTTGSYYLVSSFSLSFPIVISGEVAVVVIVASQAAANEPRRAHVTRLIAVKTQQSWLISLAVAQNSGYANFRMALLGPSAGVCPALASHNRNRPASR